MRCLTNNKDGIYKKNEYLKNIKYVTLLICNKDTILVYVGWMLLCVANSVLFVANTALFQRFLDSVTEKNIKRTICDLIVFLVVLCSNSLFSGLSVWGDDFVEKKTKKALKICFFNKINKIDPLMMVEPAFWDEIKKAKNGLEGSVYIVQTFFFMLSWHIPYFFFMSIYLYKINSVFIGVLFIVLFAVLITQKIKAKTFVNFEQEKAVLQRRIDYYDKCIFDLSFTKETKILNADSFFIGKYKEEIKKYSQVSREHRKKVITIDLYGKIVIAVVYVLVIIILVTNLIKDSITFGMFIAIFSSIERMFTMVKSIVVSNLGFIAENLSAVDFFVKFMTREETEKIPIEIGDESTIELKNVFFRYPQQNEFVLKNINLKIMPKETIVIVGENGAGKSTLANLIMGIYKPQKGKIDYGVHTDGNARYYPTNATAVFQDFARYKMTLRDNISVSNVENCYLGKLKNNVLFTDKNDKYIVKMLNILFTSYNQAMDMEQMLGSEFGGIDLSGGFWQRIAICRCLFKSGELLILDEPTSAMDPDMESQVYERYNDIATNRTTIIVSHRLGICKIADRVVVLKNGEISGVGSHDELLEKNVEYQSMWKSQAGFYNV